MCWMALIPVAMAVVGGMQQGNAQETAAQGASQDARTNAFFANQAANDATDRGRKDAALQRLRTGQMLGSQRATMAANGGVVDEGSNANLQADTAMLGELDALTIENNAAREAYGYKTQAIQGMSASRQLLLNGASAKQSSIMGGVMNGAGSMLGGFGGGGGATGGSQLVNGSSGFRAGVTQGR